MFFAAVVLAGHAKFVSLPSLLNEMVTPEVLAERPDPWFKTWQASSFDRASTVPRNEDWFANKDYGNYIRNESNSGRAEYVMCEAEGPGVLVRGWSPNPSGTMRFYIDGNASPDIEAPMADILGGGFKLFPPPFAKVAARGWSLFFPVPFQKSLKVTLESAEAARTYYQFQVRSYEPGTTVEPFSKLSDYAKELENVKGHLTMQPVSRTIPRDWVEIAPGGSIDALFEGPGSLQFVAGAPFVQGEKKWADPSAAHNLARSVRLVASFDGEFCIDAPYGEFFQMPTGGSPVQNSMFRDAGDGAVATAFPIPFKGIASVRLINEGKAKVRIPWRCHIRRRAWTDRSMHFKAQFLHDFGPSQPQRDLEFLRTTGPGVFVGCNVSVDNPIEAWWGEGDEKISVDGELFPSTFGTGTEDFFGYGWCDQSLFQHPYHAQTRCDGPANKGHTNVFRFQILDRIPFRKSLEFDMELWHWQQCKIGYARTVFWYAAPGTQAPFSSQGARCLQPEIGGPSYVRGAIEGESAKASCTGGTTEAQQFAGISGNRQLWWMDAKPGDSLTVELPSLRPGTYTVFGRFCHAEDYGIHELTLGNISRTIDFYGRLSWKTIELGQLRVKQNAPTVLKVKAVGANPAAVKRHMFGLDYLFFVPN